MNPKDLAAAVDDTTACVVVQQPNFFGCIEDAEALAKIAHDAGALVVAAFDPISLGLLKRPGDWGADIAVAEGHTLGTPMQYGGPYLGIMACREKLVRRMPGRIAGQTVDRRGKRCFVLTMQTREQHIRREKATSNVCTNQGLFALRATIYLALSAPKDSAKRRTSACKNPATPPNGSAKTNASSSPSTLRHSRNSSSATAKAASTSCWPTRSDAGFLAGVPLGQWYPELDDCFLVAVTEKRTKQEIDALARALAKNQHPAATKPVYAK